MNEFRGYLKKSMLASLDRSIDELASQYGEAYLDEFKDHFRLLERIAGMTDFAPFAARAFIKFNKEILKAESAFRKTGRYSANDFSQVRHDIYENPAVMEDYYLTGLYLTYFIWPHHYELLQFFKRSFLAPQSNVDTFMEWGVGHGLLSKLAFDRWPSSSARLFDVSPSSLRFADRLLSAAGYSSFQSLCGDVVTFVDGRADAIICGEVLEHVPEPDRLLRQLRNALKPGGTAFLTGAINAAQEDHLTLFTSASEIFLLVKEAGFRIVDSIELLHPNRRAETTPPTVLAMVLS